MIEDYAKNVYYNNKEMIRFLLVENLALKMLLHEKGLIDPDQYRLHQERAASILDAKVETQIKEWQKDNPEKVQAMESLIRKTKKDAEKAAEQDQEILNANWTNPDGSWHCGACENKNASEWEVCQCGEKRD